MKLYLLLISFVIMGCNNPPEMWTFSDKIMGTYYIIKVEEKNSGINKEKLKKELHNYLIRLNMIFSTYEKKSELSLLNILKSNESMFVSSELKEVLELSQEVYNISDGAFDVTVGPLVNAWGFGPDGVRKRPQDDQILALLQSIGMNKLNLSSEGKVSKKISNLYIDLSAIAKGHAVDKVIEFLKERKFKTAMVEIGGEVKAIGLKNNQDTWKIGIEHPSELRGGGIHKVVPIKKMAIATSGSYRNYRKYGDEVFTHTIDPRTGRPVKHKLISVSVIDENCAKADALATALMVLGPEKGPLLVEKENIMAYFLVKKDEGFQTITSNAFKKYLNQFEDKK